MILTLYSDNPHFSFLIGKNPNGLPIVRSLRSGYLLGWFVEPQKYVIYFYDNPDICSFQLSQNDQVKYVNAGQYSSPLVIQGMLNEILSSTIKCKGAERDIESNHKVSISGLRIKNLKLFQTIRDTFSKINFNYQHIVGYMYSLELEYKGLLFDLMNVLNLLVTLIALGNKENISLEKDAIEKYAKQINRATTNKVPFDGWYLRYIFKKRAKIPRNQLSLLETDRLKLTFGNTTDARLDFLMQNIKDFNDDIVDIGCGPELFNKKVIGKKHQGKYYLVDSDPKVQVKTNCYSSVEEFYNIHSDFNGTVILTEVIEHNEESQAEELIRIILEHNPNKVFITTPNFDFNVVFGNELRHDDHHWEMTESQFTDWLSSIVTNYSYKIEFKGIGDSIDGHHITSGAILIKK